MTVQGATFNMRGQLYRGYANATALSSSPVVSALGSESDNPGSIPGRGKSLRGVRASLAKSIYYSHNIIQEPEHFEEWALCTSWYIKI